MVDSLFVLLSASRNRVRSNVFLTSFDDSSCGSESITICGIDWSSNKEKLYTWCSFESNSLLSPELLLNMASLSLEVSEVTEFESEALSLSVKSFCDPVIKIRSCSFIDESTPLGME